MKLSQLIACKEPLASLEIKGVTDDSRKVKEGFCFVNTQNDNAYVKDAVSKGAVAVVNGEDCDFENTLTVEDTRKAYAKITSNWFSNPTDDLILIGVTGTNGKTTTTALTGEIMANYFAETKVVGNKIFFGGEEIKIKDSKIYIRKGKEEIILDDIK